MGETVNVVHDYLRRIDKEMTCDKKKKSSFCSDCKMTWKILLIAQQLR